MYRLIAGKFRNNGGKSDAFLTKNGNFFILIFNFGGPGNTAGVCLHLYFALHLQNEMLCIKNHATYFVYIYILSQIQNDKKRESPRKISVSYF